MLESMKSWTNAAPCRRTHTPYEEKPRFSSRPHGETENDELYLEDREHDSARQAGAQAHAVVCGWFWPQWYQQRKDAHKLQIQAQISTKNTVNSPTNVTFCLFRDFWNSRNLNHKGSSVLFWYRNRNLWNRIQFSSSTAQTREELHNRKQGICYGKMIILAENEGSFVFFPLFLNVLSA